MCDIRVHSVPVNDRHFNTHILPNSIKLLKPKLKQKAVLTNFSQNDLTTIIAATFISIFWYHQYSSLLYCKHTLHTLLYPLLILFWFITSFCSRLFRNWENDIKPFFPVDINVSKVVSTDNDTTANRNTRCTSVYWFIECVIHVCYMCLPISISKPFFQVNLNSGFSLCIFCLFLFLLFCIPFYFYFVYLNTGITQLMCIVL